MIITIAGKLVRVGETSVAIEATPFQYEVLVADYTRRQLTPQVGQTVQLHTLDFIEGGPQGGRMVPRLIGFQTEPERQFFDLFCSVDGVGVKKALRAMVRPVHELASAIESQDAKQLSALPGIGPATSERVIAKLRRKMPRFALMVAKDEVAGEIDGGSAAIVRDTFEALVALGHNESDARQLIDDAMASTKKYKDTEALLTAIYQRRQ